MPDEKRFNGLSPEFTEAIKEFGDCPAEIYKLATTNFEKAVAVEFFKNQEDRNLMKSSMGHLEYLLKLILGATGLIGAGMVIKTVLEWLLIL